MPVADTLLVDPVVWNDAIALADPPQLQITPTGAVSGGDCSGSYVQIDLTYQIQGSADADDDGVPDDCGEGGCVGDVDGNGDVGFPDLVEVISAWGPCVGCGADFDGDDEVGFEDLVQLITAWGPC